MKQIRLKRIATGWYATEDGCWAVVGDDPDTIPTKEMVARDEEASPEFGSVAGCATQREWVLVHDPRGRLREEHQVGDNIDFFDTKREAVDALERLV